MPNWNAILRQIGEEQQRAAQSFDTVRRQYLNDLHKYTDRNVTAYYSGWQSKPEIAGTEIRDEDRNGFMMAVHGIDPTKGLDLILHTPGGSISAAQSIVSYLREKFGRDIRAILRRHVADGANLNTDESPLYDKAGARFASHDRVNHSQEEYSYYDWREKRRVSTNAVEGFFGNSKRSLDGTHHHVSKKHLHLYAAELDFKYNTRKASDGERTVLSIGRIEGKRLMMHTPKAPQ